jgi:hypothetical protein
VAAWVFPIVHAGSSLALQQRAGAAGLHPLDLSNCIGVNEVRHFHRDQSPARGTMLRIKSARLAGALLIVFIASTGGARGIRTDASSPGNDGWGSVPVDFTQLPANLSLPGTVSINPLGLANPIALTNLTSASPLMPTSLVSGWSSGGGASVNVASGISGDFYDAQLYPYDGSGTDPGGTNLSNNGPTVIGLMWNWAEEQVIFYNLSAPANFAANTPIFDAFGNSLGALGSASVSADAWEIQFNCAAVADGAAANGCANGASLLWSGGSSVPVLYTASQAVLLSATFSGTDPITGQSVQLASPDGVSPLLNEFVFYNGVLYAPPGWSQTAISVPTGLAATSAQTSIALSWAAPTGALGSGVTVSYNIYEAPSSGTGVTPAATTNASITGLTPGSAYTFTVTALYSGVESAHSAQISATTLAAPPSGLTAVAAPGTVALSWNASAGATGYDVYQGTSAGGESKTALSVSTTSTSISGLTNGQTYYFTVAAVDAGGVSAASNEVNATPELPVATPPPPSKGGGGATDAPLLVLLTLCVALRWWLSRRQFIVCRGEHSRRVSRPAAYSLAPVSCAPRALCKSHPARTGCEVFPAHA